MNLHYVPPQSPYYLFDWHNLPRQNYQIRITLQTSPANEINIEYVFLNLPEMPPVMLSFILQPKKPGLIQVSLGFNLDLVKYELEAA